MASHRRNREASSALRVLAWVGPPLLSLLVGLLIWEFAIWYWQIDRFLLATPRQVLQVLLGRSGDLLAASWRTFQMAAYGFGLSLLTGIGVAILFAESRWLRVSCYPYAIFLHTVPIVAISPLIITWFGNGQYSVVLITFIVSLFPIITASTNGMLEATAELQELFRLYQASRWQKLWKLKFPSAVPQMLTGAQTASGLAIVGAIVGEYFAGYDMGQFGLGYYIFSSQGQFRIDIMLAAVILSTLLGITLFAGVTLFAQVFLKRWLIR